METTSVDRTSRPERTEAAAYYFTYIDQVPAGGDICDILDRQSADATALLRTISETRSQSRYAADKWSLRELLAHVNDTERVFVWRALWFARGFSDPLPSFDQNVAVASAGADARSWASLVDEFQTVRGATLSFFRNLPDAAWRRRGVASDNPFSVRALAFICAGHVAHHLRILQERYVDALPGSRG